MFYNLVIRDLTISQRELGGQPLHSISSNYRQEKSATNYKSQIEGPF